MRETCSGREAVPSTSLADGRYGVLPRRTRWAAWARHGVSNPFQRNPGLLRCRPPPLHTAPPSLCPASLPPPLFPTPVARLGAGCLPAAGDQRARPRCPTDPTDAAAPSRTDAPWCCMRHCTSSAHARGSTRSTPSLGWYLSVAPPSVRGTPPLSSRRFCPALVGVASAWTVGLPIRAVPRMRHACACGRPAAELEDCKRSAADILSTFC